MKVKVKVIAHPIIAVFESQVNSFIESIDVKGISFKTERDINEQIVYCAFITYWDKL